MKAFALASPVSVPGYIGTGYMVIDKTTGDSAFMIGGGGNGGWIETGIAVVLDVIGSLAKLLKPMKVFLTALTNIVANLEALHSCLLSGSLNAFKLMAFMFALIQTIMFVVAMTYVMTMTGLNLFVGTLFAMIAELIQGDMQGRFLRNMC